MLSACLQFHGSAIDDAVTATCAVAIDRLLSYISSEATILTLEEHLTVLEGLRVLIEGSIRLHLEADCAQCFPSRGSLCELYEVGDCADPIHRWAIAIILFGSAFAQELGAGLPPDERVVEMCLAYSNSLRLWSSCLENADAWLQLGLDTMSVMQNVSSNLRHRLFLSKMRAHYQGIDDTESKLTSFREAAEHLALQLNEESTVVWIKSAFELIASLRDENHLTKCGVKHMDGPSQRVREAMVKSAKKLRGTSNKSKPVAEASVTPSDEKPSIDELASKSDEMASKSDQMTSESEKVSSTSTNATPINEPACQRRSTRWNLKYEETTPTTSRLDEKEPEPTKEANNGATFDGLSIASLMRDVAELVYSAVMLNVKQLGVCRNINLPQAAKEVFGIRTHDHPNHLVCFSEENCTCPTIIGTKAATLLHELATQLKQHHSHEQAIIVEVLVIKAQVQAMLHLSWEDMIIEARGIMIQSTPVARSMLMRDLEARLNPARFNAPMGGLSAFEHLLYQILKETNAKNGLESALITALDTKLRAADWWMKQRPQSKRAMTFEGAKIGAVEGCFDDWKIDAPQEGPSRRKPRTASTKPPLASAPVERLESSVVEQSAHQLEASSRDSETDDSQGEVETPQCQVLRWGIKATATAQHAPPFSFTSCCSVFNIESEEVLRRVVQTKRRLEAESRDSETDDSQSEAPTPRYVWVDDNFIEAPTTPNEAPTTPNYVGPQLIHQVDYQTNDPASENVESDMSSCGEQGDPDIIELEEVVRRKRGRAEAFGY